jgi:hypothetical protein
MDELAEASLFVRHGAKEIIVERAQCYAFYSGIGLAGGWFRSGRQGTVPAAETVPAPSLFPDSRRTPKQRTMRRISPLEDG